MVKIRFKLSQLFIVFFLAVISLFFVFIVFNPAQVGLATGFHATTVYTKTVYWQDFLSVRGASDFEGQTLALFFKGINQDTDNASFILTSCLKESDNVCLQPDEERIIKIIDVPVNSSISGKLRNFVSDPLIKEDFFLKKINYNENPNLLNLEIQVTEISP